MVPKKFQKEFDDQLNHCDSKVLAELKEDSNKELRSFYKDHWEEVNKTLSGRDSRSVIEDLEAMGMPKPDDFIFVKQINDAIKNGNINKADL